MFYDNLATGSLQAYQVTQCVYVNVIMLCDSIFFFFQNMHVDQLMMIELHILGSKILVKHGDIEAISCPQMLVLLMLQLVI